MDVYLLIRDVKVGKSDETILIVSHPKSTKEPNYTMNNLITKCCINNNKPYSH